MILLGALMGLGAAALAPAADLPRLQEARNVGLASLEQGDLAEAQKRFEAVRRLAPGDPLGWADGAVAALRAGDTAKAATLMAEALRVAPANPKVVALEGVRREQAKDAAGALGFYDKAVALDPKDLVSRWSAARLRSENDVDRPRAIRDLEAALEQAPANLFLLLRLSELHRRAGDARAAASVSKRLAGLVSEDPRVAKALADAQAAADAGDREAADLKYRIVENLLRVTPRFQQARHDVDPGVVGLPLEDWGPGLAEAAASAAGAGEPVPVTFTAVPAALQGVHGAAVVRAGGPDGRDVVFGGPAGLQSARRTDGAWRLGSAIAGSASADLAVADVTNSGSLEFATPGGLWVDTGGSPRRIPVPPGDAVVPLDFDSDGDLDLYLSSPGPPGPAGTAGAGDHLLRNNLDGSWTDVTAAAGIPAGTSSVAAVAADFDRDGDTDLLLLLRDGGFLLLDNLRGGRFAPREAGLPPAKSGAIRALHAVAGDLNGDGRVDLVYSDAQGTFAALNRGDGRFLAPVRIGGAGVPLLFDFDNDGFLDLFVSSPSGASALYRGDGAGRFAPVSANAGAFPPALAAEAVDADGDGDLDLVLVTTGGGAEYFENRGGNANAWIDVALEGLPTGSAKVNRLGYGSEVEAKAQDLYVYRVASRPVTRLGLGARRRADVLRIVWTNGIPQNQLAPPVKTVVREVQQLKGSCPFLYAYDGSRWQFVTDVLGRAPVGLLYDGVHEAPADTGEWLVVSGSTLAPSAGRLVLDFTEELWETVYFDLAELRAVDHPAGVELVANEKMVPPPFPEKRLYALSRPLTPRAIDGEGRDRTREIAAEDGVYVSGFAPTRYQGIVAPHELILELPEARRGGRVMLYLTGWIQYADTSINVSLAQRRDLAADGPVLEVPDGRGAWKAVLAPMGYPAGKTKTMPVDLTEVVDRSDPRVRIRTNLAIFWDRIAYTVDDPEATLRVTPLVLRSAELFDRGFSRMVRESPDGPQVFLHDDVSREPRWADMAGRYTRFGDVRELLTATDDRYVVLKGGDAVRLSFDVGPLPPLPAGWTRDYLVVLDGWEKDADKNTVAGQTVEPLPFHGMDDAGYGRAESIVPDPSGHREFVREYLTRSGGPDAFRDAIRLGAPAE
ncbi:MAG TPA: FG-GAP-like repeat-containing protein [Thermoanaerobaculia bacterium]|jgi:tetratricopeptide (TPR) repeat protein